ncbi:hypothetical protein ACWEIJ_26450 [Lentzea sp. NPDC004789]
MPAGDRPRPNPLSEHADVYGLLQEIRLRPGMWIREGRLPELETTLRGYGMALEVHGIGEQFPFGAHGAFNDWLAARFGWGMSCGWAHAIEQNAGPEDPLELFFRLVDEYRADPRAGRTPPRRVIDRG